MSNVLCPNCKASIARVKPVRIPADPDTPDWQAPAPMALGFICSNCKVLLPLTPTSERDEA